MRNDAIAIRAFLSPLPRDRYQKLKNALRARFTRVDLLVPLSMLNFLITFLLNLVHVFMLRSTFSRAAKMSTYTTDKASPFTRAVISSMRKLYHKTRLSHRESHWLMFCLLADTLKHWQIKASITLDVCHRITNSPRL